MISGLFICFGGEKLVAFCPGQHHEALKFIAPFMGHEALIDAETVPGGNSGVDTNDAVFEGIFALAVVVGTNLIQLGQSNGLINSCRPVSIRIFSSLSFTSI